MSTDALDVYASHRKQSIELHFANQFSFDAGATTFEGIFDYASEQAEEDGGHVDQKQLKPRILVDAIPPGLSIDYEVVNEYTGETFNVQYFSKDDMGVPYIWLY